MTLRRASWLLIFAFPVAASGVYALATWKPPAHAVHTSGAIAVQAQLAGWAPMRGRMPAPTTSLDELRCAVVGKPAPCPDAASPTQRLWPDLIQSPGTLYVALSASSWFSGLSDGYDVEFVRTSRTLFVHNYGSEALYVPHHEEAPAALQPGVELLVVSTAAIPSGTVTVVEDNWIERLTGDEFAGQGVVGTAAIP